jgi:hypothetical protein
MVSIKYSRKTDWILTSIKAHRRECDGVTGNVRCLSLSRLCNKYAAGCGSAFSVWASFQARPCAKENPELTEINNAMRKNPTLISKGEAHGGQGHSLAAGRRA